MCHVSFTVIFITKFSYLLCSALDVVCGGMLLLCIIDNNPLAKIGNSYTILTYVRHLFPVLHRID